MVRTRRAVANVREKAGKKKKDGKKGRMCNKRKITE